MQVKVSGNASWASVTLVLTVLFAWIAGVVLANGFCSTVIAIFFPFWSFYLVVEKILILMGWV